MKKTKTIKKNPSLKRLHDKAWALISRYVRTKDADWRGYTRCYTCKVVKHYKELQAGHFWHGKLDFDPRNLRPQCKRCNKFLSGNLDNYAMFLIDEVGLEAVKKLRQDAARHPGYTRAEILQVIEQYKDYGRR